MSKSKIQWTDITINPIHLAREDGSHGGHWCRKVSPECANCYAESQNQNSFFPWASKLKYQGEKPPNLTLDMDVLKKIKALKRKKIFLCSMTDLFGDWIPDEWIKKILDFLIEDNNSKEYKDRNIIQILTKRSKRMKDFLNEYLLRKEPFEYENIWFGVSVGYQKASYRIDDLITVDYPIFRFLSCEPLIEYVDLKLCEYVQIETEEFGVIEELRGNFLDWIIVGGESGTKARTTDFDNINSIVEQVQEFNNINVFSPEWQIALFVKQLGSNISNLPDGLIQKQLGKKGQNFDAFPEHLKVREFPN